MNTGTPNRQCEPLQLAPAHLVRRAEPHHERACAAQEQAEQRHLGRDTEQVEGKRRRPERARQVLQRRTERRLLERAHAWYINAATTSTHGTGRHFRLGKRPSGKYASRSASATNNQTELSSSSADQPVESCSRVRARGEHAPADLARRRERQRQSYRRQQRPDQIAANPTGDEQSDHDPENGERPAAGSETRGHAAGLDRRERDSRRDEHACHAGRNRGNVPASAHSRPTVRAPLGRGNPR